MNKVSTSFIFWLCFGVCLIVSPVCSAAKPNAVGEISGEVDSHAAHAAGEHHDPTHSFAGADQSNPMEWRGDSAIFSLIVFLLLLAVLAAFAWKPISQGLEKREASIATMISDAQKASESATAKLKEYQVKLESAQAQAQELVTQARKDAEASAQRIVADAQAEAARQRDRALADIETAKQAALSELTGRSTDMAFSLARRVVGRELNPNDHQNLIQEALRQMPNRN